MELKVKHLSYGHILKDISFTAKKGDFIAVIGPNGSGKTTLLKNLNGILEGKGSIEVFGKKKEDYSVKEFAQKMSFMKQNTNLAFDFPSEEVVVLGRYPYLPPFSSYTEKDYALAREYMKACHCLEFAKQPLTELSGGERQRVLFAKCLCQESEILLLDEPTAALDMAHEEEIFSLLSKEEEKIILCTVHNLRMAIKYCNRLLVLAEGKLVADGKPEEILNEELFRDIFHCEVRMYTNPITGRLDFCQI